MSSRKLFLSRISENGKYQWSLVRSIMDWTILVYIVVPAAAIFIITYREWWQGIPHWMGYLSFPIIYTIFFFLLWGGHLHTYTREADQVFLMKNKELLLGLKRWGIFFSYLKEIGSGLFAGLLLLPLWTQSYPYTLAELAVFLSFWTAMKVLIKSIRGRMELEIVGWRRWLRSIPLFLLAAVLWNTGYAFLFRPEVSLPLTLLLFLLSLWLAGPRFLTTKTLATDIAIDHLEKNKNLDIIFGLSMELEKPQKVGKQHKQPMVFSKSQRLFRKRTPKNGFLELFLKAMLRSHVQLLRILQIASVTAAAITVLPPLWIKIAIGLCGSSFFFYWIGNVWHQIIETPGFSRPYAAEVGAYQAKRTVTSVCFIVFLVLTVGFLAVLAGIRSRFPFF